MPEKRYRRLFRLRFTRSNARDVDDEFQFHLTMRARELERNGLSPDEAQREALAQFGDMEDARASCRAEDEQRMRAYRRTIWMDAVRSDVRTALRLFRRRPAFAVSTVATLGIAVALAAAAYGVVNAYLVRSLPFPDADRIVRFIGVPSRTQPFPNPPDLSAVDWTAVDTLFASTVRAGVDGFTLADGDRPEVVYGTWISPDYFDLFGVRLAAGREFTAEEHKQSAPVAIISDDLWTRRYARDPSIIGRSIQIRSMGRASDGDLVTVVGITPPGAWHINRFTDVLRPFIGRGSAAYARLAPGVSIDDAAARVNAAVRRQLGSVDPAWRMSLYSLQDQYTYRVRPTLLPLIGGAVFLLLIAAGSVAGAQAARAAARSVEIQIRMALGASRARIVAQLLAETAVIAVLAAVLGAVLAELTLGAMGALAGQHLVTGDHGGAGVPGGAGGLRLGLVTLSLVAVAGTCVGLIFGFVPAVIAARQSGECSPGVAAFGAKGSATSAARPAMRRTLIVAQVAFTMVLLVGAGLMLRTALAIGQEPLGFSPDNVLKGDVLFGRSDSPTAAAARGQRIVSGLTTLPAVSAAALVFPHPFWTFANPNAVVRRDGLARSDAAPEAKRYTVTPGYFDVLRVPIAAGRDFNVLDGPETTPVAIVSADLARRVWPGEEALGRRIRLEPDSVWRTVVGVVGDTRESVESVQRSDVYVPYAQRPEELMSVVVRGQGDVEAMKPAIQRAVATVDRGLALSNLEPLANAVSRDGQRQRALASTLSVFAVLGLMLAMLAVYASLAYVVTQRRREIAIRVAVGASPSAVRSLVLYEAMLLVALGLTVGAAASLSVNRLLSTLLYGVAPTDPGTFAGIALLVGASALVASVVPLRHAARVHPVEVLRAE